MLNAPENLCKTFASNGLGSMFFRGTQNINTERRQSMYILCGCPTPFPVCYILLRVYNYSIIYVICMMCDLCRLVAFRATTLLSCCLEAHPCGAIKWRDIHVHQQQYVRTTRHVPCTHQEQQYASSSLLLFRHYYAVSNLLTSRSYHRHRRAERSCCRRCCNWKGWWWKLGTRPPARHCFCFCACVELKAEYFFSFCTLSVCLMFICLSEVLLPQY